MATVLRLSVVFGASLCRGLTLTVGITGGVVVGDSLDNVIGDDWWASLGEGLAIGEGWPFVRLLNVGDVGDVGI